VKSTLICYKTPFQPLIVQAIENNDNQTELDEDKIVFQQDGASAHYTITVSDYLNQEYPGKWIGRHGPIQWPPRSLDLTLIDFFGGHLKKWSIKQLMTPLRA